MAASSLLSNPSFAPNEFHLPSGFRNLQQPHRPAAKDLIFRRIVNQKATPFPSAINDTTNSNQRRPRSAQGVATKQFQMDGSKRSQDPFSTHTEKRKRGIFFGGASSSAKAVLL
ncbi:hypothetical protein ACLOJK_004585 [Asimina triloba]